MKQLELELQKRLLVVEVEKLELVASMFMDDFFLGKELELICEGSELTEEIIEDIVHGFDLGYFVDYNHHNPRAYKLTAMESFISYIESQGYYWGNNENLKKYKHVPNSAMYKEAESLTFNLKKTLIFEIL